MEGKVFQYILIERNTCSDLGKAIDDMLKHDWELYGNPIAFANTSLDYKRYCQAMILRENIKQEGYNRNEI